MAELDAKWDGRMTELDAKWDGRMTELDAKWERRLGEFRTEMQALNAELIKWTFVFIRRRYTHRDRGSDGAR